MLIFFSKIDVLGGGQNIDYKCSYKSKFCNQKSDYKHFQTFLFEVGDYILVKRVLGKVIAFSHLQSSFDVA